MSHSSRNSNNIIASHYKIDEKIGEGSFGIIFKGFDLSRDNQPVAIKFESRKTEAPQLKDEFRAYKILNSSINSILRNRDSSASEYDELSLEGIPKVYYYGQEGYYSILIIQLLGPSLEDLFDWCGRRFSIKTVAQVAKQMIRRIQFVHANDLIYRDIKPDNFLILLDSNTIYLVDFGMIKQYRNPVTKQHIPYRERKSLSGTLRYMSINTHLGREQSRRDDLESLGHVFLYFCKGELPWQGLKAPNNKLKYEKIGEKKQTTPLEELCFNLPVQFQEYMKYVRGLKFDETPDYDHLVSLFDDVLSSIGTKDDGYYDWMDLNDGKGWDWSKNKKTNLHGYGSNNNTGQKLVNATHHEQQHRRLSNNQLLKLNKYLMGSTSYQQQQQQYNSRVIGGDVRQEQLDRHGLRPVNDNGEIYVMNDGGDDNKGFFKRWFCFCC